MRRHQLFAAAALAAAAAMACATNADRPRRTRMVSSPAAADLPESELVCTVDYETGSNIPTRFCRTRAEAQADRDQALQMPVRPLQAPAPPEVQGARRAGSGG